MTRRFELNRAWEFTEHFDGAFLRGEGAAVSVELPHTCRETPYDYFDEGAYQMVCGYRRTLRVPEDWAGKRVFLHVGAARTARRSTSTARSWANTVAATPPSTSS